jgi:hypothetical protein
MAMTQEEKRQANQDKLMLSIIAQVDREESDYPQKELDKFKTELKRNASSLYTGAEIETELKKERDRRFEERRAEVLAKRPEQEAANPLGARTGRATMKDGGKGIEALRQVAPDVVKRMGYQEGGEMGQQMDMLMGMEQEQTMLPDEKMEEDYVDYVVEETLSNEDRNYLIDALEKDDRLSVIFDQVIETAHEFSGSGTIEGPGTGKSDSIPARLSDGEFVITAKATEEIGADNLMSMMKDAEAAADERQMAYDGGMMREEKDVMVAPKEPVQQNINVTKSTVDNGAAMPQAQQSPIKAAIKEDMMLDPYQRHVRS